jgi:two-component system nitrate/nitrite response regulator NarL
MKRCIPTLLLVPNSLLWEGLARLLATTDYKPIRCSASLEDLVRGAEFDPTNAMFIVGWDSGARTTDSQTSLNEVRALRERYPGAYVVIMSAVCDVDGVVASLHAGADGYILSSMTCEMLTKSFDLVMSGETVLPSEFTRAFCGAKAANQNLAPPLPAPAPSNGALVRELQNRPNGLPEMRKLSGREMAIMSRLREGDSNKIIARRIGLAEATVKTHVKAILRKVGVKNRTQAALWAIANLVDPADGAQDLPDETVDHGEMNGASAAELPHLRNGEELAIRKLPLSIARQRSRATIE